MRPMLLAVLLGFVLCAQACDKTPRLPRIESPSDQNAVAKAHDSYRQAIEANPQEPGPFAAYCAFIPEITDRRLSELRNQLEVTKDASAIKPMIVTLGATRKELEAANAWLTAHCRCQEMEFNKALVAFRERAKENEAFIISTEALAQKHMIEQAKLSAGFAERARQLLGGKRMEDAVENAGHALEFNSENALAAGIRELVERFEKARALTLDGHLQAAEPIWLDVQKSGFLVAESQAYLIEIRTKRQRVAQVVAQADTLLKHKRLPEAAALLKSAMGIDKDADAALSGRMEAIGKLPTAQAALQKKDFASAAKLLGEAQALWPDSPAIAAQSAEVAALNNQAQAREAFEQAQKDLAAADYHALAANLGRVFSLAGADKALKARATKLREETRKLLLKDGASAEKAQNTLAAWRAYEGCTVLVSEALCKTKEAALRTTLAASYASQGAAATARGDWAQAVVFSGLARQLMPKDADLGVAFVAALAAARAKLAWPLAAVPLFGQAPDLDAAKALFAKELAQVAIVWGEPKEARFVLAVAQAPKPESLAALQEWLDKGAWPPPPAPPIDPKTKVAPAPAPQVMGALWVVLDPTQKAQAFAFGEAGAAPRLDGLAAPILSALAASQTPDLAGRLAAVLSNPANEAPADWFVFLPLIAPKAQ